MEMKKTEANLLEQVLPFAKRTEDLGADIQDLTEKSTFYQVMRAKWKKEPTVSLSDWSEMNDLIALTQAAMKAKRIELAQAKQQREKADLILADIHRNVEKAQVLLAKTAAVSKFPRKKT